MFKKIKNKITIRKGFVTVVILIALSNILFLGVYYEIYLNDRINNNYQELTEKLQDEVNYIVEEIKTTNNLDKYLTNYIEEHKKTTIILKDDQNNHIKTYQLKKDNNKNNIIISSIIIHQDEHYLITISKNQDVFNFEIAIHFLLFELFIVAVLGIIGFVGANFKILGPISLLSKDLNNYKFGILPKKRKVHSSIDILQNDFVDLVDKLEEEKQKQSRIIASISHDIKTPLTSILGYSQRLLTNDNLSSETKEKYANTIYSKSLVMKEIVEEFDDYLSCNIKDDKKLEKISIRTLADYLNNYYKEDLKEKEIEFKVKSNCLNKTILVDLPKFKRIFSNTITNSIRHFDKERKILNININEQKNGKIKFEIADNGPGCKEDLVSIFEPLYTTDKSSKISGLGLSICKEIVESHNGTIKAENNKLGGFSIIFIIDTFKED